MPIGIIQSSCKEATAVAVTLNTPAVKVAADENDFSNHDPEQEHPLIRGTRIETFPHTDHKVDR